MCVLLMKYKCVWLIQYNVNTILLMQYIILLMCNAMTKAMILMANDSNVSQYNV